MAGVILRTAAGTTLYLIFLWLVRIDDWRVAGMMLTFPMLNGIGLVGAGTNADHLTKAMMPVIVLNGAMCFLFATALVQWTLAREHPAALTAAAAASWIVIYAVLEARNVAFSSRTALHTFVASCTLATAAATYWSWPGCIAIPTDGVVRSGGLAGVIEGWASILLFALSLAILFGFAHSYRHAHAAIGRLAALPLVPLFGLYTVAALAAGDTGGLARLQTMQSVVLVGWIIAVGFVVAFSSYVMTAARAGTAIWTRIVALIIGWALSIGCIVSLARLASAFCGIS